MQAFGKIRGSHAPLQSILNLITEAVIGFNTIWDRCATYPKRGYGTPMNPGRLNQGFKDIMVDYSADGEEWTHWGKMTLPKAQGDAIYGGFSGPDLSNISAQYILITATSNHGDEQCYGIAEIKFNLLPELGAPVETDEDDEESDCADLADVDLSEVVEVEVEMTEAFLFLEGIESEEEYYLILEYRASGEDWIEIEVEEEEIELFDLQPGTTYEYRFQIECGEELFTTSIGYFYNDMNAYRHLTYL